VARQIAELTAQRDAALRRAELAEFRERATQDRTATQIDTLRQRLKRLGADPYD
jgi:ubiquinone biosynthesis protein UbiJ